MDRAYRSRASSQQKISAGSFEEIDSDLDERLYAAVFHSKDISHKSEKDHTSESKEFEFRSNERHSVCGDKSGALDFTRLNVYEENPNNRRNCFEETRVNEYDNNSMCKWTNSIRGRPTLSGSETDLDEICHDIKSTKSLYGEAIVSFKSDVPNRSAKQPNDSTDTKTEGEPEKFQSPEKVPRISLFGDSFVIAEKDLNSSALPKLEEEPEKCRSIESDPIKIALYANRTIEGLHETTEASFPSGSMSFSFSGLAAMTLSSSSEEDCQKKNTEKEVERTLVEGWSNVVTIIDSEDSICEIPVPPKPKPLTVYLEDSSDSTSSGSDTQYSGTISDEKLSSSWKIDANSDTASGHKLTGKKGAQTRHICLIDIDESSESDSSCTTKSERESWGIVTGTEIDRGKKNLQSLSDDNVNTFKIAENVSKDFRQGSIGCSSLSEEYNESNETAEIFEKKSTSEDFQRSSRHLESTTKIRSKEIPMPEQSHSPEKLCTDTERLLTAMRQAVLENNKKNYGTEQEEEDLTEDGTLILNVVEADGISGFVENIEEETTTTMKMRESRKRSMTNSGTKSGQSSPLKRAKNLDEPGEATTSNGQSFRENKEYRNKTRNCAADYFFQPMSSEMRNFYNNSWGGENLDVDALRRQMPRDPRHWSVSNEDLLGSQRRKPRYWAQMKCRNCNDTGHAATECTQQKKIPNCHMCGMSGHREPRCPHKQCLGCGKKQKTYMQVCSGCRRAWCNGCQSLGHEEDNCPDLWRRYHLTTSITDLNTDLSITDVMKPQHLLNCCNCAKRGHDSATCNSYRWSRHFPTPAHVTNYTTGPVYTNDSVPVDDSFSLEAEGRSKIKTRPTNTGGGFSTRATPDKSSSRSSEKKKKCDKTTSEDPPLDPDVGGFDETMERSGNRDEVERSSKPPSTNSETTDKRDDGVTLKFESKHLDDKFKESTRFGVCEVSLSLEQYESLAHCDFSRQFLTNLTLQFPINIEIKSTKTDEMKLLIASAKDLHSSTRLIILGWLKFPLDERSRFVNLNLPTTKEELVDLLSSKLDELNEDLGDPFQLFSKVQSLKSRLRNMQQQTKAGRKPGLSPKRARIVGELANLQCRLNMILIGQSEIKKTQKSYKYLKRALISMQKVDYPRQVHPSDYIQLVHHYRRIFAAYTPDDLKFLLNQYKRESKNKRKLERSGTITGTLRHQVSNKLASQTVHDKTYVAFPKSIGNETTNTNRDTNSPSTLVSPNVASNKSDKKSGRYFNCSVENQFQPSSLGLSDKKCDIERNLHRPNPQTRTQPMHGSKRKEGNYYKSTYDFGKSSEYRMQGGTAALKNLEQKDYIPLDSDPRDVEKESENHQGGSSSASRDRRHEDANIGFDGIFYVDREAGSFQDFDRNSRNEVPTRTPDDGNTGHRTEQQQKSANKKNKKRPNKFAKLPHYLQKRAAINIEKYSNFGNTNITQAAGHFQRKCIKKTLTWQCVDQFEKLLKRTSGIKDHLL